MSRTYARPPLNLRATCRDEPESITKKKGESLLTPPFVHDSRLLNLELISPVQIAVEPAPTTPGSAVLISPEVFLYGRGQV